MSAWGSDQQGFPGGYYVYCYSEKDIPSVTGLIALEPNVGPPIGYPGYDLLGTACANDISCGRNTGLFCEGGSSQCLYYAPQICFPTVFPGR